MWVPLLSRKYLNGHSILECISWPVDGSYGGALFVLCLCSMRVFSSVLGMVMSLLGIVLGRNLGGCVTFLMCMF